MLGLVFNPFTKAEMLVTSPVLKKGRGLQNEKVTLRWPCPFR